MNDSDFCDVINCERTSHKTFTDTMLEMSLIVEEKIAVEMKGKKELLCTTGGVSIPGTMSVCLLRI
jgi:hypothetical protein